MSSSCLCAPGASTGSIFSPYLLLGHRPAGVHPGAAGHPGGAGQQAPSCPSSFWVRWEIVLPQGCSWTVMKAKCSPCCLHLDPYTYTLYISEHPALPTSQQHYCLPLLCTHLQGAGFQYSLSHEARSGGKQRLLRSWCPCFRLFNLVMF